MQEDTDLLRLDDVENLRLAEQSMCLFGAVVAPVLNDLSLKQLSDRYRAHHLTELLAADYEGRKAVSIYFVNFKLLFHESLL